MIDDFNDLFKKGPGKTAGALIPLFLSFLSKYYTGYQNSRCRANKQCPENNWCLISGTRSLHISKDSDAGCCRHCAVME